MPKRAELIVEVAHPSLWKTHTETLLSQADVIVGSPSGKISQKNTRRFPKIRVFDILEFNKIKQNHDFKEALFSKFYFGL